MRDEDQPSGDPENSGPAPWSEKDWATYLRRQDLETARFLAFYHEAKGVPDRLDVVARRMGWEPNEWSPTAEASETEPDMETEDRRVRADFWQFSLFTFCFFISSLPSSVSPSSVFSRYLRS